MNKSTFTKRYIEVMLVVGIASVMIFSLDAWLNFLNDFLKGFLASFGVVMILFSLAARLNKSYMKKVAVEDNDERMQMINSKVLRTAYYFHIIVIVALIILFGTIEETKLYSVVVALALMIEQIFAGIIKLIYSKRY